MRPLLALLLMCAAARAPAARLTAAPAHSRPARRLAQLDYGLDAALGGKILMPKPPSTRPAGAGIRMGASPLPYGAAPAGTVAKGTDALSQAAVSGRLPSTTTFAPAGPDSPRAAGQARERRGRGRGVRRPQGAADRGGFAARPELPCSLPLGEAGRAARRARGEAKLVWVPPWDRQ